MIPGMGRDRTKQPTLDLFSTAGPSRAPSPWTKKVSPTQEWRHVLPNDLPNAVRQLDDRELDQLITVSLEEAKRRGKLLPNTPNLALGQQLSKMANQRQRVEVAPVSLTRGQVNAIRAAAKAGIKPSVIARQFGIAQSDVRKVMASDTPGRGTRYG